jgi:uncharacterized protein YdhG (YjbR/CyaY superfamily)
VRSSHEEVAVGGRISSIEDYLAALPPEVLPVFEEVRSTIRAALPTAVETIAYDMPTWTLSGQAVVHLGAWKRHLSIYPVPEMDEDLARVLAANVVGRGTLQLPLTDPMPLVAIAQVVRLLAEQRAAAPDG